MRSLTISCLVLLVISGISPANAETAGKSLVRLDHKSNSVLFSQQAKFPFGHPGGTAGFEQPTDSAGLASQCASFRHVAIEFHVCGSRPPPGTQPAQAAAADISLSRWRKGNASASTICLRIASATSRSIITAMI